MRAFAAVRGDYPGSNRHNRPKTLREAFWLCLNGYNRYKEHSDLWIPTAIGFFELLIYPVLLVLGNYAVIGGWIGVKTAGGWAGYAQSRTSFNRFLLWNILTMLAACVFSLFITRIRC